MASRTQSNPPRPAVPVPASRPARRPVAARTAATRAATPMQPRAAASRRPLSRLTLDDERSLRTAAKATDLAAAIIGSTQAVTDDEWSSVGRILRDNLGPGGVARLHAMRTRIAADLGIRPFPTDEEGPIDGRQSQDWEDHRQNTMQVQSPPDRALMRATTKPYEDIYSPTASRRKAAGSPKGMDIDVEDPDEIEDDFVEDPLDIEGGDKHNLDADEMGSEEDELEEEQANAQAAADDDEDDLDDEDDEDDDDEDDLDDEDGDFDDDDDDGDYDEDGDIDAEDALLSEGVGGGEGPEEFTLEDADKLHEAGLDGVLTDDPPKKRKSNRQQGRQASRNFRPSRWRFASAAPRDEWDGVFLPR